MCVCQRKTKDRADGVREKRPIPLDGIRTCTSGICAHCASNYTTRVRPPRVSRNKHFRHSPVSSIAKQSCMITLQLLSAGPRRQASARTSAELDEACQRKTKDIADGVRGKSAHSPRRESNLYLWDTRPPCFRLHHECVCARARVCVCVCVCQRKRKERADGMREKSAYSPRRDLNLYLCQALGRVSTVLPITPRGQPHLASVKTNTSDTHPTAPS